MTDGKKDQLKRKKTLEYELRRLYRAGELTEQQIAELKEAEFPFDTPVRRTANGSRSKISSIVLSRCIRRIWI